MNYVGLFFPRYTVIPNTVFWRIRFELFNLNCPGIINSKNISTTKIKLRNPKMLHLPNLNFEIPEYPHLISDAVLHQTLF